MDVRMPDGTLITNVPDNITQADLLGRYTASQKADANIPDTLQLGLPGVTGTMNTGIPLPKSLGAFLVGGGEAATRIGQGLRQLMPGDNSQLDQQVANEKSTYAPLASEHPWATGLGEALPAAAIPVGAAATIPAAIGRAALANAIPAALQYGSPEERAKNAAIAGAAGGVGAGAAYGLGRLVNPIRSANPMANSETQAIADAANLKLTPAQATGSNVLSSLDGTLATFPGSASKMAKIRQGQMEGFNRAAMSAMGQEPTSSIANDAATIAGKSLGAKFNSLPNGVTVPIGQDVVDALAQVESKYMKRLPTDVKPIVGSYIDDILAHTDNGMPGDLYQAIRSDLGNHAASLREGSPEALAYKGIQKALDNSFAQAAPADVAAELATVRGQYRNFKTLKPLVEKAAMSSSNIPPAQVMSRALATDNTSPSMQNLAQLGNAIGRDYPNSGTVPRMFWMNAMEHPLAALGLSVPAATAWATAQAVHSPMGRAYLTNSIMTPELEKILMRSSGLLGLAGASGAGLLK